MAKRRFYVGPIFTIYISVLQETDVTTCTVISIVTIRSHIEATFDHVSLGRTGDL